MTGRIMIEKVARPELAKHESSILDLAFVMDCTGSMASYIENATNNIHSIVEEIVVSEKSDIRLALVEYRDHPPQDHSFVTRVHDFTARVSEMKGWLQQCQANGGGDLPEAVADGLHAVLKLSWRTEATKICIMISDAPPHGLDPSVDSFPNGCPDGLDPVQIVREMAEKHITLYSVGAEPSIVPYRDFFMSLAYITGGQYVPMVNAKLLAKVIIGGVREEISLDRLMQAAEEDINREMQRAEAEGVDDKEKIRRINNVFSSKNLFSTHMTNTFGATTQTAKAYSSTCQNMAEMQHAFLSTSRAVQPIFGSATTTSSLFAPHLGTPSPFTFGAPSNVATTATSNPFTFGASSNVATTATSNPFAFGTPSNVATTATSNSFTFGPPSNVATTATSNSFTFGPPSNVAVTATFNPSTFGAPSNVATTATSNSFTFGPPPNVATTATSNPFTFGPPSNVATTATTSNSFIFGTSSNAALGTNSFGFGTSEESSAGTGTTLAVGQETHMTYDVTENAAVNEDQAERIYQKWQHRKK